MNIKRLKRKLRIVRKITFIKNYLYWAVVFSVLILGITVVLSSFNIGGLKILSVMSGSMSPNIYSGSLIFTAPKPEYKTGDVITYRPDAATYSNLKGSITHRIIEVQTDGSNILYLTKGDNNPSPDAQPIPDDKVAGKVLFSIPILGYASAFVKTPYGFTSLIMIPALLVIVSEIRKLYKDVYGFRGRRIYR